MDLTAAKGQFTEDVVDLSRDTLRIIARWNFLNESFHAHQFAKGEANAFTDGDFQQPLPVGIKPNPQFDVTIMEGAMFAIGTLANDANPGLQEALLATLPGGLP